MTGQVGNRRKRPTYSLALVRQILALALLLSLALAPSPASADTFVVSNGLGCKGASGSHTHLTVQAAVDAAVVATDPVIEICPGNYPEEITVDDSGAAKDLIIQGVGLRSSNIFITGAGAAGPIIDVVAANSVSILNLTVDGLAAMTPAAPGGTVVGIRYRLVSGIISDVFVQNIRNAAGSAPGVGISLLGQIPWLVDTFEPTQELLQIFLTTVQNTTGVGILADGDGVKLDLQEISVVGPVMPFQGSPSLLQISNGAEASISESSF